MGPPSSIDGRLSTSHASLGTRTVGDKELAVPERHPATACICIHDATFGSTCSAQDLPAKQAPNAS